MTKEAIHQESLITLLSEEQRKKTLRKTIKKGKLLYRAGEVPKGFFYVEKGLFGLTIISENGVESLVRIFTPKSYLGHRSFLAEDIYHASALALKDSEVLFFPNEWIDSLFSQHPQILLAMSKRLAKDLKEAEMRLNDMVGKRAFNRVAEALLFLKNQNEEFPWTRKDIGEFCGVKTETVSRVLRDLEENNLIKKEGRLIEIINEDALINFLNH